MARLNAKTAKALRKAAEYKNPTTTPVSMPFPGIAYFREMPVTIRYINQHGQQRAEPKIKLCGAPETYPVPVTKPAKHDPKCSKGVYRQLKRLTKSGDLFRLSAAFTALEGA